MKDDAFQCRTGILGDHFSLRKQLRVLGKAGTPLTGGRQGRVVRLDDVQPLRQENQRIHLPVHTGRTEILLGQGILSTNLTRGLHRELIHRRLMMMAFPRVTRRRP